MDFKREDFTVIKISEKLLALSSDHPLIRTKLYPKAIKLDESEKYKFSCLIEKGGHNPFCPEFDSEQDESVIYFICSFMTNGQFVLTSKKEDIPILLQALKRIGDDVYIFHTEA